MFSSTSHLISSLARHLGKNLLVCLIHPCSVQLWYLGMQHLLHPGGTFGPVDDGQNLPSPGSLKLLNGVEEREVRGKEKRHHSRMGVKPDSDCTGNGGMPHCPMWSHIIGKWSPTCPHSLEPVFGANLLKSHIYAGVHFSTQDQPKELLFYCISYGHATERSSTPECVS